MICEIGAYALDRPHDTHILQSALTNIFQWRELRSAGLFEMEVRYTARPVMVLFALVPVDSAKVLALPEDLNEANGSAFSFPGVLAAKILAPDACLETFIVVFRLDKAKRKRVLNV